MKTIAAAAFFLTLTASAWADEPESKTNANTAAGNEPIVLSEAEMDGVTAGAWYAKFDSVDGSDAPVGVFTIGATFTNISPDPLSFKAGKALKDAVN